MTMRDMNLTTYVTYLQSFVRDFCLTCILLDAASVNPLPTRAAARLPTDYGNAKHAADRRPPVSLTAVP